MAPPFIPYYIDYNVKNQSKTIGVSKKRVTFKFGFASRQAVQQGLVGAHCRGSEHECVFTWSLNSGKRHVTMDGKDVHFSTSGQNGWTSDRTWQHVFSLKVPNYTGTFRCHLISQPAPQGSNIRPFDLRVGGVSIFKFNQIFMLGTPQMTVRKPGGSRATHSGDGEEPMSSEERRMLAAARVESMREFRKEQDRNAEAAVKAGISASNQNGGAPPAAAAAPAGGGDLLMSFDGPPTAPPMPAPQGPPVQHVSSLTVSDFGASGNSFAAAPPPGHAPYGYPAPSPQHPGMGQTQQRAVSYGQAPPQQQAQNPFGASFSSQPTLPVSANPFSGAASASTAPTANTAAMTPYQSPAGQAQSTPGYSLGSSYNSFATAPTAASTQAPAPTLASSLDPYAKPPADPWATPAAPAPPAPQQQSYGQLPPQQQPGGFPAMQSPSASTMTYGSAPAFARPPPQQQPGFAQQPAYGAPPVTAGNPYGAPPQYQQQQQSFTGF